MCQWQEKAVDDSGDLTCHTSPVGDLDETESLIASAMCSTHSPVSQ